MAGRFSKGDPEGYAGLDPSGRLHAACCEFLWPIGSIFTATVSTSPADLFGFGTWEPFGAGRVLVGIDGGDADFDTAGETGGEKAHTLTVSEMPSHAHTPRIQSVGLIGGAGVSGSFGASNSNPTDGDTNTTGGGQAHNNLPPYVVVYRWRRTA